MRRSRGGVPPKVTFAKFCRTKGGGGVQQKVTNDDKTQRGGGQTESKAFKELVEDFFLQFKSGLFNKMGWGSQIETFYQNVPCYYLSSVEIVQTKLSAKK